MNEYPLHCEAVTEPRDTEQALSEIHAAVHQAIQQLPPKCREVFRLHYLQGMDYEEIAKELKVSISTVRNQKARALALLRKQMGVTGVLHLLTLVTVS
jgi:RNA polymerase sigma-70 factor (ECF subfamily)